MSEDKAAADDIERVARALAPIAWAALGIGDTLAQKNRRAASLRHARTAIEAMSEIASLRSRVRGLEQLLGHIHLHLTNDEDFGADELEADMRKLEAGKWIDTESLLIDERNTSASLRSRVDQMVTAAYGAVVANHRGVQYETGACDMQEEICKRLEEIAALTPPSSTGSKI